MEKLPYLNLGCGSHFDERWVNMDFSSSSPFVIEHNLLNGIPFPSNHFEVVYHSHVLEHFHKIDGEQFIRECNRVLIPGGIIRIAIPDLEQIINNYTRFLTLVKENPQDKYLEACYDWIMLELYDQTVRNYSGGGMLEFLSQEHIINETYVFERCGFEVSHMIDNIKLKRKILPNPNPVKYRPSFKNRILNLPNTLRRKLLEYLLDKDIIALNVGKFRLGGEVHSWMYDSFSLGRLLSSNGFTNVQKCDQQTSSINEWREYKLEQVNGKLRKPDSLFIEAIKV